MGPDTTTTNPKRTNMQSDIATEPRDEDPSPPGSDYDLPRVKLILAAIGVCLAAVGIIMLFGGGSSEPSKPTSAEGQPYIDGTLVVVEETRLVLKPADGGPDITFAIRPQDVRNFDIAHLQSHSSVGIPTRIYYEEDGDTKYALYKEDAPVNSQPQQEG
jgi:hypothetical protein